MSNGRVETGVGKLMAGRTGDAGQKGEVGAQSFRGGSVGEHIRGRRGHDVGD